LPAGAEAAGRLCAGRRLWNGRAAGRDARAGLGDGAGDRRQHRLPARRGGGAAFEAFLLEDLKPFIEAHYPADPRRSVLFGHSAGGLFAANVFADRPDAFYGYVIGSASAWADPSLFARLAAAAGKAHGQHVYL